MKKKQHLRFLYFQFVIGLQSWIYLDLGLQNHLKRKKKMKSY